VAFVVPELVVERRVEDHPTDDALTGAVNISVAGRGQALDLTRVDTPWAMRSTLEQAMRFVHSCLPQLPEEQDTRRSLEIEIAAANGMLHTLDPHSLVIEPETYAVMRGQTTVRGSVGVVIAEDRRGRIMVRTSLPGSPAETGGVKSGDHIVRIDDQPTAHMTMKEAIKNLQGEIGTAVRLSVEREGTPRLGPITLERAALSGSPPDLAPRLLTAPPSSGRAGAKIAYFRVPNFQPGLTRALFRAMVALRTDRVGGIILDLRGNSGGLYDEAIKMADLFIATGTLASMVSRRQNQRKDEVADDTADEPIASLAVLVDQHSAAASEIVAGAIKNLDRGVIIGQRTSGAGTVQVLFDRAYRSGELRVGLKLTTAELLAANGTPIQEIGVVPDIEITPIFLRKAGASPGAWWTPPETKRRESEYEFRLRSDGRRYSTDTIEPPESFSFVSESPVDAMTATDRDDTSPANRDPAAVDEAMALARDILAQVTTVKRSVLLASAKLLLAARRQAEDQQLVRELGERAVDWTPRSASTAPPPRVLSLALDARAAGETLKVRATATNTADAPAHRVRALLRSSNPLLDGKVLAFGLIRRGETRACEIAVTIPAHMPGRTDHVHAQLVIDGITLPSAAKTLVRVGARPSPRFALRYQFVQQSDQKRPSDQVQLRVEATNTGDGPATRLRGTLATHPSNDDIPMDVTRFDGGSLAPGATKTFVFAFRPGPDPVRSLQFELKVGDLAADAFTAIDVVFGLADIGGAQREATPPVLIARAPGDVLGATARIEGTASDDSGMRDVFITVAGIEASRLPRKVFYSARSEVTGNADRRQRLSFATDVPLVLGQNQVHIRARDANGTQSMATVMVLRRDAGAR
jgi:carboxyl-terminal processing protease